VPFIDRLVKEAGRVKPDKEEPIRVTGIATEAIGDPGGSPMDDSYDVPFRLSREASPRWEQEFLKAWDRLSTRGQAVTASVGADQIILNATTIDDVERFYLSVLKRAVAEANRVTREEREKSQHLAEREEQKKQERRRHLMAVVERLNFED
jgi:hypothetical protein